MNCYIYFAVIISGASVLAIELLGTRVIAPFYGASLYLWSALISVTLAALSVGYAIGGRLADRGPRIGRFALIVGAAGLWVVLTPWLRYPVLALSEGTGLRTAVLITSTILFFPPLALLGMVSPYAIRLKASSLDVVGRTAGNLYSVSTIASVVAAVVTGFFLIPNVGVSRLLFIIGFALIVTAAIGLVVQRKRVLAFAAPLVVLLAGLLALGAVPTETADPAKGLMAVVQSAYAEIRVIDLENIRYMFIDGTIHSAVNLETGESGFEYVDVMDLAGGFFERPGNLLLVGLGAGSIAANFSARGWRVDAVEIDPVVTRIARSHFSLQDDDANIFHMDGRQFLISQDKAYDLIVMDAFGSSSIPFHLVTEEAFELIRSRLTTEGVLAMNIHAIGWHDAIVYSVAATANRAFRHVLVLPIAEPPDQLGNLVLLASNHPLVLDEEPPVPNDRFSAEYNRAHAWDNRFEPDTSGAVVFTDDLNAIDVWTERINLASRRSLHEFFTEAGLIW
jgi:spermidine synthase